MLTPRLYCACFAEIVLLICGAGAQDHALPTGAPAFTAQGAFFAIVVADPCQ